MDRKEKQISYSSTNTYQCLNSLNEKTEYVWIVLHGIGHLSRYFLKYFNELPKEKHYVIAPQAPSKYYLDSKFKQVGASWLTRENREMETKNVLSYLNSIYTAENIPDHSQLIVLGFSQGVSIATRWVAKNKIPCTQLILYAGGIPEELTPSDFNFRAFQNSQVKIVVGDQDNFLSPEILEHELSKADLLFKDKVKYIQFKGGHEVKKAIINSLVP